jgi:beta-mannosidase
MVKKFSLLLSAYDMQKHEYIALPPATAKQEVILQAGYNTELGSVEMPERVGEESLVILAARLVNEKGEVEARIVNWPEPFRYLSWHENTSVSVSVKEAEVRVKANYPVKGCLLYVGYEDGEDAEWDDNMLDLMPGEELSVKVKDLNGRKALAKWLNDWELKK